MNEDFENIDESAKDAANRFDEMLKSGSQYYFDVFEFENIIDFYISKREYRKAQNVVEYALTLHPNAFSIMTKHAQILIKLSQPIKALRLLKKLSKLENSDANLPFLKGIVYCTLGDIKNALDSFDYSLSFDLESKVDILYNISIAFQDVGRFDFAINYLKKAYDIDNEDVAVIYELAFCYDKLNYNNLSINFYKEYISKNPFSEIAWFNIAMVYDKIENYTLAIDAFDYAIAIDNKYGSAYLNKARCLVYDKQYEESIEVFKEYLKILPNDSLTIFYIGESYSELNKSKKAIEYFDKAFQLDNKFDLALFAKANTLYENNNLLEAYHTINQAIKINNKNDNYWYLAALINKNLDFIDEAEKSFKKSIELNNSDVQIWIEYSKLNYGKNETFKIINILSEAFEYFKEDAEVNYRLAAYLAKNNNFDSAAFHLKLALNKDLSMLNIFKEIYSKNNEAFELIINQHQNSQKN